MVVLEDVVKRTMTVAGISCLLALAACNQPDSKQITITPVRLEPGQGWVSPQPDTALSRFAFQAATNALKLPDSSVLETTVTPDRTTVRIASAASRDALLEAQDRVTLALIDGLRGKVNHLEFSFSFTADSLARNLQAQAFDCTGATRITYPNPRAKPTINLAKILLNPGHGLTQLDSGAWALQRLAVDPNGNPPVFVQEDANNLEMAIAINSALVTTGANVASLRSLDKTAIDPVSGKLLYLESAKHNVQALNMPEHVWNSEGGKLGTDCNMGKDIRVRAFAANFAGADALIGLHSNANNSTTARGTWVLSSSVGFTADVPAESITQSADLARKMGDAVVASIRQARPELNWPDPVIISSDQYGETGYAKMPAVILEVGFHTSPIDGPALGQDSFRQAVGVGIRNAVQAFFPAAPDAINVTPGVVLPAPTLIAPGTTTEPGTQVSSTAPILFSWAGVAGATRYGLYISKYPYGLGNVVLKNEIIPGSSTAFSLDPNMLKNLGETRFRWNLTAFNGANATDAGTFSSSRNFTIPPPEVINISTLTPSVTMSSNGRVLTVWPELVGATQYEFSGTFDGAPLVFSAPVAARGSGDSGAVLEWATNPSDPAKQGKQMCLAVRVKTATATSAFSSASCVAYRYYDKAGLGALSTGGLSRVLISQP